MGANPVAITDIESRWRPLSDQEETLAQAMLDDIWARALAVAPSLESKIESGAVAEALVVSVLSAAVIRVLRNPEGVYQQQIDDYSYTRDKSLSSGGLYLSAEELKLLGVAPRRAVSMNVSSRFGDPTWQ